MRWKIWRYLARQLNPFLRRSIEFKSTTETHLCERTETGWRCRDCRRDSAAEASVAWSRRERDTSDGHHRRRPSAGVRRHVLSPSSTVRRTLGPVRSRCAPLHYRHYHTVARQCLHRCKSDLPTLWRWLDFGGGSQLQNSRIHWRKVCCGWLRRRYPPASQNSKRCGVCVKYHPRVVFTVLLFCDPKFHSRD